LRFQGHRIARAGLLSGRRERVEDADAVELEANQR
jgi:hypothetical protein